MKTESIHSSPSSNAEVSNARDAEETLDLGRVFSALKRQVFLIGAITAAVAALAGVRAKLSPADYSATFEILIQPSSGEAEVATGIAGLPQQPKENLILEDQVKILTSPGVLNPVIDRVRIRQLDVCNGLRESTSSDTSSSGIPIDINELCYKIIRGNLAIQLTEVDNNSRFGASRIFTTQYTGSSPEDVQQVAELISQRFLDYGLESRQRDIQQGIAFLDVKLPDVRRQVDILQQQLEALRKNNNLITPEARGSQLSAQIGNYESEYLNVLVELREVRTLYQNLQQQLSQNPQDQAASPVLSNSQRYQTLVQQLLALDNEIAEASTLFVDSSPDMQVLLEQRQQLLNLLGREGENAKQELVVQMAGLSEREEALQSTLASLNQEVDNLAGITREFTDLQRDLDIATENLTQLLARREALQIEAAQRELPWELISPPTLATNTPSLPRNLALGVVLGLLLGVGVALAIDAQQDVLYNPNDLKRVTPVPLLGLIPNNGVASTGYDLAHLKSLYNLTDRLSTGSNRHYLSNGDLPLQEMYEYKEAFRSLVANLRRVDAAQPLQSLVLSPVDDDSADLTSAAYLAWTAAEMGNRVLLVDSDFRVSMLHDVLGIENNKGFSDLLVENLDPEDLCVQSPSERNLFVMTAGTAGFDPVRLLSADAINQAMGKIEAQFDLVIYNTPAFFQYVDASLLAAETSGLVLVAHLGVVKSHRLEQTLEKLWLSRVPLMGLLAKEAVAKPALLPV